MITGLSVHTCSNGVSVRHYEQLIESRGAIIESNDFLTLVAVVGVFSIPVANVDPFIGESLGEPIGLTCVRRSIDPPMSFFDTGIWLFDSSAVR